ncbi:MAG: RluA family pseudouridine synthase [Treponema sp.]|nr:RluA family pseudouridine synthase [Treponema sp.]
MDFVDFKTGSDDEGRRLDKVIRIFIPKLSLAQVYKSLRKGFIKVNHKKAVPEYRIQKDDRIFIADFLIKDIENTSEKPQKSLETPQKLDIEPLIVFLNKNLLVINKPQGINIHPSKKGEYSLIDAVTEYYNLHNSNDSLAFKPGPLHRLDKMTSGLVCFSMSHEGAVWFSKEMKEHNIKKTYMAIVQDIIKEPQEWKDSILKEDKTDSKGFHTVQIGKENGKESITHVNPVKYGSYFGQRLSVVEFNIETGRQHQIRAQSSFHGHPLWGDTAYGGSKNKDNGGKHSLCAFKIEFPKNDLGIPPVLKIESGEMIKKVIEKLED